MKKKQKLMHLILQVFYPIGYQKHHEERIKIQVPGQNRPVSLQQQGHCGNSNAHQREQQQAEKVENSYW